MLEERREVWVDEMWELWHDVLRTMSLRAQCASHENREGLKRMGDLGEQRKWGHCLWCVKTWRGRKGFERKCQWEAQDWMCGHWPANLEKG